MFTDWIYYIEDCSPNMSSGKTSKYNEEFRYCLEFFLEQCKLSRSDIEEIVNKQQKWVLSWPREQNIINSNSEYTIKFTREKFIEHNKFIRMLREYYNTLGFFIKGPQKIKQYHYEFIISRKYSLN